MSQTMGSIARVLSQLSAVEGHLWRCQLLPPASLYLLGSACALPPFSHNHLYYALPSSIQVNADKVLQVSKIP